MAIGTLTPEGKKYMAENDLRTLIEAARIRKDAARMKAVMQCKKEQVAAMEAINKGE